MKDAETAWLDSESERTHGLTVRQTLEHADEIARGMKDRCDTKIREHPEQVVQGIVFSNTDVLFLIDAYLELRAHIDEEADAR